MDSALNNLQRLICHKTKPTSLWKETNHLCLMKFLETELFLHLTECKLMTDILLNC